MYSAEHDFSMDTVKSLWHLKSWVMLQQGKYLYFKERTSF